MSSSHVNINAKFIEQLLSDLESLDGAIKTCEEKKEFDIQVNQPFLRENPRVGKNFSEVVHGSIRIASSSLDEPKGEDEAFSSLAEHIKFFMGHSKDLAGETEKLCTKILDELKAVAPGLKL